MRKRHFIVLIAVVYVMAFGVLNGEARSGVHVRRVAKNKLGMAVKAVGGFAYNAKLNRWEGVEGTSGDGTDNSKKPVVFKPVLIGRQKVPAYYDAGNMMADPCDNSFIIITDQSYAIVISMDCGGDSDKRLRQYMKSFNLPKGVHAVRAKEQAGWEVID
jgi:hypothetical protein